MNEYQRNLFNDLMKLCAESEAFYYVDQNVDGKVFRVFTYRLASYTDFCKPNALECRGHTFLMNGGAAVDLVCFPMPKYFNGFENPFVMDLDFTNAVLYMNKLDGSLISTVKDESMPYGFRLKSKTSFVSQQAVDAYQYLLNNKELLEHVVRLVNNEQTVNFEWIGMSNVIVIGYPEHSLKILNSRSLVNGNITLPDIHVLNGIPSKYVVEFDCINRSYDEILNMTGVEGFVVVFSDGRWAKFKCEWYTRLHAIRSGLNSIKNVFSLVVSGQADDIQSSIDMLPGASEMFEKVRAYCQHEMFKIDSEIASVFKSDAHLDRKSFAIKNKNNPVFSLLMQRYSGKEIDLPAYMIKNYDTHKSFLEGLQVPIEEA